MNLEIKKEIYSLNELRNDWEKLLQRASDRSIVKSWEWMNTWWEIYGKERELFVLCGYYNGKIVGIAPLAFGKEPSFYFKILKYKPCWLLGSGQTNCRGVDSEYNGFIIEKGYEEEFIKAFFNYIIINYDWDEIILKDVSVESYLPDLLKKHSKENGLLFNVVSKSASILIKLPETWDSFMESLSSSMRYKIRRGRKEFLKLGGIYHLVKKESELPEAFADLEKLHQYRWNNKVNEGAFSSREWKSFHEKVIPLMFGKGRLKLSFLKTDNYPVAANYNFIFDNKIHFFQSGMIPHENKHVRLGLILHSFCIEEAINQGVKEYDFLKYWPSASDYKKMWGNYYRDLLDIRISKPCNKERVYQWLMNALVFLRGMKQQIESKINKFQKNNKN